MPDQNVITRTDLYNLLTKLEGRLHGLETLV